MYPDEWIPCVRCGKRTPVEMCNECLQELDDFAAEALKAIATEEEINEWKWQHDMNIKGELKNDAL